MRATTLLVVLAALVAAAMASGDPCLAASSSQVFTLAPDHPWVSFGTLLSQTGVVGMNGKANYMVRTPSQQRACLTQPAFAYNATVAADTIRVLQFMYDFYVFLDQDRSSGAPFDLQVDLAAGTAAIGAQAAAGAMPHMVDFHGNLTTLVHSLKDGHSRYMPPTGFMMWAATRPLAFTVELSGSTPKVVVRGDASFGMHDTLYGGFLADYFGMEVVAINGRDPMSFFTEYAETDGSIGKPKGTNFNTALKFTYNYPNFPPMLPTTDVETYLLRDAAGNMHTVAVNTLIVTPVDPSTGKPISVDVLQRLNAPPSAAAAAEAAAKHAGKVSHKHIVSDAVRSVRALQRSLAQGAAAATKARMVTPEFVTIVQDDVTGFQLRVFNGTTLVLTMPDFEMAQTETLWSQAFFYIERRGQDYERLLIDVRSNAGGDVCLGVWAASLFGTFGNASDALNLHDMRKTPGMDKFLGTGIMQVINATAPVTESVDLRTLYDSTTEMYARGGSVPAPFTAKFKLQCGADLISSPAGHVPFTMENIGIITDGICVSTCATFTKTILHHGGTFFGVGGLPDEPLSISFSIGNPVVVSNAAGFSIFGSSHPNEWPSFPTSAQYAYPFAESYEFNDPTEVAEFVLDPVTHRLPLWLPEDSVLFNAVLAKMS